MLTPYIVGHGSAATARDAGLSGIASGSSHSCALTSDPAAPRVAAADGGDGPARRSSPTGAPFRLSVRNCRYRDLPGLRRIKVFHRLNQPESALAPYSPVRAGLGSALPRARARPRVLVASTGDRIVGFAQFQPLLPDQRWRLVALGAATGVFEAGPVWEELIGHGVMLAGLQGVKRLYARVPEVSPVAPAVAAVGFAPYATETVMVAFGVPPLRGSGAVREQEPTDTWAIHQLYNAVVPRQVQYAEALTDHAWQVGGGRADTLEVRGWLIEEGHHAVGYARVASRAGNHVVELIHHPERPDVLPDLVDGTLANLALGPVRRVACPVRGYQAEVATALAGRGFAPILEQVLSVKYTTATIRVPALEPARVHLGVRERLPQRVPTFLHGRRGDDPAS